MSERMNQRRTRVEWVVGEAEVLRGAEELGALVSEEAHGDVLAVDEDAFLFLLEV